MEDHAFKSMCPTFFSTAAIITTMVFAFWCQSFAFQGNSYTLNQGLPGQQVQFDVDDLHISPWYMKKTYVDSADLTYSGGEWTFTVYTKDECIEYGSDLDTKWTFVRVATIITPSLGAVLTLLVCLTPCFAEIMSKAWYLIAMTFALILTTLQGLTFLMFKSNACSDNPAARELTNQIDETVKQANISLSLNSTDLFWDDSCSWDKGSSANVVSIACWFLAGLVMLVLGAPISDKKEDNKGKKSQKQPVPAVVAQEQPQTETPEPTAVEEGEAEPDIVVEEGAAGFVSVPLDSED